MTIPEWKEYTGSDEQIAEMLTTEKGFIVDSQQSIFKDSTILKMPVYETHVTWLKELLADYNVKQYLICNPHPLADMICQQARTGQPVWVRTLWNESVYGYRYLTFPPTTTPNWHIPNAEYSFTPFEEEV